MASTHASERDNSTEAGDPDEATGWKLLADKYWLKPAKLKEIDNHVIKSEIWDVLQKNTFYYRSLLHLENLQILEK